MKRQAWMVLVGVAALGMALAYGPRFGAGLGAGTPQAGVAAGLAGTLHDEVAALLGVTPEELIALHQQGKTLAQIAQELGVDLGKLEAQLVEVRNAAIDEAVKAGSLTQAQAALMKTRTQAVVRAMLQREVGPAAGFVYGPAYGAQAWGKRTGQPVAPAPGYPTCPYFPQGGAFGPFGPAWNR
ncbi:hypothetical protein FJNA_20160 [Thermus sp. FJN-A]